MTPIPHRSRPHRSWTTTAGSVATVRMGWTPASVIVEREPGTATTGNEVGPDEPSEVGSVTVNADEVTAQSAALTLSQLPAVTTTGTEEPNEDDPAVQDEPPTTGGDDDG